jgi:hypothetical protein
VALRPLFGAFPVIKWPQILLCLRVRVNGDMTTSAWLPIKSSEVVHWLTGEDATDESAWARRLRT